MVVFDIQNHVETAAVDGVTLNAACLWGKSGLLFAGSVNGTQYTALWRVDLNPETGAPLAAPVQIQLVDHGLALSRTANGNMVVAVFTKKQPDVYVATLAEPGPSLTDVKRITSDPMQDYPQAWTADSKSVLFEANESLVAGSAFHIYKQAINGPPQMESLVPNSMVQVLPQLSPDGKWILFASKPKWLSGEPYALYRVSTAGGAALKVEIGGSSTSTVALYSAKAASCVQQTGIRLFTSTRLIQFWEGVACYAVHPGQRAWCGIGVCHRTAHKLLYPCLTRQGRVYVSFHVLDRKLPMRRERFQ